MILVRHETFIPASGRPNRRRGKFVAETLGREGGQANVTAAIGGRSVVHGEGVAAIVAGPQRTGGRSEGEVVAAGVDGQAVAVHEVVGVR